MGITSLSFTICAHVFSLSFLTTLRLAPPHNIAEKLLERRNKFTDKRGTAVVLEAADPMWTFLKRWVDHKQLKLWGSRTSCWNVSMI